MTEHKTTKWAAIASGALFVLAGSVLTVPATAQTSNDSSRINLLRPDRLLVQITEQDSTGIANDRYRLQVAYRYGQDRDYPYVSRSNLLNSPAARYFARKLTGFDKN